MAAGIEMTTGVELAFPRHASIIQTLDGLLKIKIEKDVVVPCVPVWMEEQHSIGKVVIVVLYVREIHHSLMALILWHLKGCVLVVNSVDT